MNSKIEFVLKPVTGAASAKGGYHAILTTAKGDAMDFDDVITEALDRGYIAGVKDILAKSVVKGVLDSMIAGVLRDGITRRIGDYLSISMKVHGRFTDEHDEFDPNRHKLALTVKQLNAFRPSFEDVEATNIHHKRQFRIYSVRSVGYENEKNGHLVIGREFVIKGADFDSTAKILGVALHANTGIHSVESFNPPILSLTDNEIRCAWPEDFTKPVGDGSGEIAIGRNDKSIGPYNYTRRSIKVNIYDIPKEQRRPSGAKLRDASC